MPEILFIQQQQLQGIGRTLQGTILTVNMHSALLNNTFYALSKLSHIVETETSVVCMVRDLMSDLLREINSSVNNLSGGTIPSYLVPLSMVENIVQSATTTTVQTSQVHFVRIWDPSHVPWLGFFCTFCCAFGLVVLWRKFIIFLSRSLVWMSVCHARSCVMSSLFGCFRV